MNKLIDLLFNRVRTSRWWPLLGLLLLGPLFAAVRSYENLSSRETLGHAAFQVAAGLLLVVIAGLLLRVHYVEHWRYRRRRRGKSRVVVADSVAWHPLQGSLEIDARPHTLVRELDQLLEGLDVHAQVLRPAEMAAFVPTEQDGFAVRGIREGKALRLETSLILTKRRVENLFAHLESKVAVARESQVKQTRSLALPAKYFLRDQFLFSGFSTEANFSMEITPEQQPVLVRLVLRYAVAMMLYYDNDPRAGHWFRELARRGPLLAGLHSEPLASIYKIAAFYFIVRGHDYDCAMSTLKTARALNSADEETKLMCAYLLLANDRLAEAGQAIQTLNALSDRPEVLPALKGEYECARGKFLDAIRHFEQALAGEKEDYYRARMHLAVALAYGRSGDQPARDRAAGMIKHLEDAIRLKPSMAALHVLKAFAWALRGDVEMFKRASDHAATLIRNPEEQRLYDYWRAKSLLEFPELSPEAREDLDRLIGDPLTCKDAALLVFRVRSMFADEARQREIGTWLRRALELEPDNRMAHRLMGIYLGLQAELLPQEVSGVMYERAIDHLLKAIQLGDDRMQTFYSLGLAYLAQGDLVNAERYTEQAAQIAPTDPEPLATLADLQVREGRVGKARGLFGRVRALTPDDADQLEAEALCWRRYGYYVEAEAAYRAAMSLQPDRFALRNNLGCVLFELDRAEEALEQWREALRLKPGDADALAGRALGQAATGDRGSARESYHAALQTDRRYADADALRREFLFSEKTCALALALRDEATPDAG
jgi:tetratricopeptide (TPR) repeat protein